MFDDCKLKFPGFNYMYTLCMNGIRNKLDRLAISALKVINLGRDRHKCIIEFVVFIGSLLGSCKAIVFDLQKGED